MLIVDDFKAKRNKNMYMIYTNCGKGKSWVIKPLKLSLNVIFVLFTICYVPTSAWARFCEGGHICSLPRECCTQGCCPPYQSGPRQLPPPSEHVLNLFFISHWFFWCVVVAIILAILCAYSLWRKRRTLCGWGFSEHHAQSEGDSAGSCYAPPQYSRCSSFHHPPPPYTEVTSKPDLYPLVFTCNSDNGKNGSSYLMVQYFRNYIVRPAGSLSAASTVDSLSSSFICNVNEANTLVPPPYSRAASPEIGFTSHFQQQYMMPRSASQLVCPNGGGGGGGGMNSDHQDSMENASSPQIYQHLTRPTAQYTAVTMNGAVGGVGSSQSANVTPYHMHMPSSQSSNSGSFVGAYGHGCGGSSDQRFRYMTNRSNSVSDIFVDNAIMGGRTGALEPVATRVDSSGGGAVIVTASSPTVTPHPQPGGTPVIYSNGCIRPHSLHRASTTPSQFGDSPVRPTDSVLYNSSNSVGGISIAVPMGAEGNDSEFRDLHVLRRSLETCCQLLQQQRKQQQQQPLPSASLSNSDAQISINELAKKYVEENLRNYATSGTCSGVSSLVNVGSPNSPSNHQSSASSPTADVKQILDQISQLQDGTIYEDILINMRPILEHTMSSPSRMQLKEQQLSVDSTSSKTQQAQQQQPLTSKRLNTAVSSDNAPPLSPPSAASSSSVTVGSLGRSSLSASSKRPSSLQQNKKKYSPKPNPSKAFYIPMMSTISPSGRSILKSPVSSVVSGSFFTNRGRTRKGWISRSAPTTPATGLPPNRLDDDSPLLNEHDEEPEDDEEADDDHQQEMN